MLSAKIFRLALLDCLERPHGGNLVACDSAAILAREFRDGVAGLLCVLAEEGNDTDERRRPYPFSLSQMLMEVWTTPRDEVHLKNATGRTRRQWLDAPLWAFAT